MNFKKITAIATSVLMTGMTVGSAMAAGISPSDLGGQGNIAIVYGSAADASDRTEAVNIDTVLKAQMTSTGSTTIEGESVLLAKSSDKLNLNNAVTIFGTTVDKDDLPTLLADGTYRNEKNTEYAYEQKLSLAPLTLTHFQDSDFNDKEPTVGFKINSNAAILNYTLDFTTDAESTYDSNGNLLDIETTELTLLGKNYYVLDMNNGTTTTTAKMTLLDSANSMTVSEGETVNLNVGGKSYDVSLSYVTQSGSTDKTKLIVNGELTTEMTETSDPYKLSDGSYLGIKNIVYNSKDSGISQVEFSVGSGKLEIDNGKEVQLNDEDVDGLTGYITKGSASSSKESIDKIVLEWKADEETFLAKGSDLVMPGFKVIKMSMGGFVTNENPDELSVDYSGDDELTLTIPVKDGEKTLTLLHANSTGEFDLIGKASDERLVTSGTGSLNFSERKASNSYDKYFVASYATTSDAESYILSATVSESEGKNRTTIKNEVTGMNVCKDKAAGDTCDMGDVSLTIAHVFKNATDEYATFNAGTNVNFSTIYTKQGLKVYLPYIAGNTGAAVNSYGAISFADNTNNTAGHNSDAFYLYMTEENKDGDIAQGTTFNLTVNDNTDGQIHITAVDTGSSNLEIQGTSDDTVSLVYSDLATEVKRIVASDKGKAEISYNGKEAYAEVYLTSPDSVVSSVGNMIFKDSEASSYAGKNVVIVGGSCINTAAAEALGVAAGTCGAAFTEATSISAGQFLIKKTTLNGKIAVVVAGYDKEDTMAASEFLQNKGLIEGNYESITSQAVVAKA